MVFFWGMNHLKGFFFGDESPQGFFLGGMNHLKGFFWGMNHLKIFFGCRDGPTQELLSNLSFVKRGMVDGVSFELYPPKFLHSDSSPPKKKDQYFFSWENQKIKKTNLIKFDHILDQI